MPKTRTKTTDAVEILRRRFLEGDPQMEASVQQERDNLDVAQQIHDLRTAAGLSQKQLAAKVGTTASVICRLEGSDYEGHSLNMLRRVAAALGRRIEVRFVPASEGKKPVAARKIGANDAP
jgi:ribosome-binding protein aMBF1 (putative translation factor)